MDHVFSLGIISLLVAPVVGYMLPNVTVTPLRSGCQNLGNTAAMGAAFTTSDSAPPFYLTPSSTGGMDGVHSTFDNFTGYSVGEVSSNNLILVSGPWLSHRHLDCQGSTGRIVDWELSQSLEQQGSNTTGNTPQTILFTEEGRLAPLLEGGKPEWYSLTLANGTKMDGVYLGMDNRTKWAFEGHPGVGGGSFMWWEVRLLRDDEQPSIHEDWGFLKAVLWDRS